MPISKALCRLAVPLAIHFCFGFTTAPLVTFCTVMAAGCLFVDLLPEALVEEWPAAWCISPYCVFRKGYLFSPLTAPLMHDHEGFHFYYAVISFARKAYVLEVNLGTRRFLCLLLLTALMSGLVQAVLNLVLSLHDDRYFYSCSYGLVGVVFALKVMKAARSEATAWFQIWTTPADITIQLPWVTLTTFSAWTELLVAVYFVPQPTVLYHFSGLVSGMIIVLLSRAIRRRGIELWRL